MCERWLECGFGGVCGCASVRVRGRGSEGVCERELASGCVCVIEREYVCVRVWV